MNTKKIILYFAGLLACIALTLSGHAPFLAVFALWIVYDCVIAPRQAALFDNNFGTLSSALILQQALTLLFTKRPVLSYFSTNLTDESGVMAKYLQTVNVRTKSVATVGNFGDAAVDVTTVDVPVTLNQWKQIYLNFTPQQYEATDRDLIQEQAEPVAVAIGNYIIDAAATLMTAATFTTAARKTVKGLGWDYTHLTNVRGTLTSRGVPDSKRFYLASEPVYTGLLNDPMVVAQFNNPDNAGAIKSGVLPVVAGLGLAEYPALTAATGDATVVGFAGTPGAIAVASRAPQGPPKSFNGMFPGNVGYITDPKSGFTIRVSEWIDPVTFSAKVRVDWIMGVAKGQLDEGQVITNV